jgi:hypothetical protein
MGIRWRSLGITVVTLLLIIIEKRRRRTRRRELPSILRNPKVHHRVHKSPPMVPILSQIDPVYTIPSSFSEFYFKISHPPASRSS